MSTEVNQFEARAYKRCEKKWDQYGIESKETAKIIDELEKCLGV